MDYEMRTDAELLIDLFNDAPLVTDRISGVAFPLSRKLVASWTGMSVKTISDYCTGKYNIPIDFWRRWIEHNFDVRILQLLLGNSGKYEIIVNDAIDPLTPGAMFKSIVEQDGLYHKQMMYLADIIADGRIDEVDNASVERYHHAHQHHRVRDLQIHEFIMASHAKSFNEKVSQL